MPQEDNLELVSSGLPEPDPNASALYESNAEAATTELKLNQLQEQLESSRQDREQRKKYADRLFTLIVVWLIAIGVFILLHGLSIVPFSLAVVELTTLIGSTTAAVLGLFAFVVKYLFATR